MAGLLCEEEVLEVDNVKYCGYCKYHFNKMVRSRNSRDSGTSQLSGGLLFIQGISFVLGISFLENIFYLFWKFSCISGFFILFGGFDLFREFYLFGELSFIKKKLIYFSCPFLSSPFQSFFILFHLLPPFPSFFPLSFFSFPFPPLFSLFSLFSHFPSFLSPFPSFFPFPLFFPFSSFSPFSLYFFPIPLFPFPLSLGFFFLLSPPFSPFSSCFPPEDLAPFREQLLPPGQEEPLSIPSPGKAPVPPRAAKKGEKIPKTPKIPQIDRICLWDQVLENCWNGDLLKFLYGICHCPSQCWEFRHSRSSWFFFQSRKDKERPKQKHKKRPESPNSLPSAPVAMAAEKGSSSHHEATKESSEVARAEAKGRKSSSHGSSHKGKKMGSGKSSAGFGSAPAGGTFQTAGSSCGLPGSQDFAPFPKLEQEDEKFRKATSSSSSSHCSPLSEGPKADVFEQKVIFSGFGSIMRFSTSAVGQPRARDASPVDYKASSTLGGPAGGTGGAAGSGHKRMALGTEEGEMLKEKKHKGSKKNKHGPGRPKAGKGKEVLGAQLAGSTSTSSSPFSGGSLVSSSVGNSSRSFSHPGSLPSLSMESPLLGSGIYTSNKDPIPLGAALRAVCSTPLPSGLLPHQGSAALPQLSRSPFASSIPASSSAGSTTQVFSLAGSTFSLPSSHIFGSPLTSGLSLNPLLSQPESSRAEPDLEDCGFGCRGTSPQESLSSMSPISSLPTLFDQTVSCSSSRQLDNVPQATPNIEQLLEKQGNGEAGVNIVEMLKALHSLQKENQRLQEQIMTLTAKKERLQLLNVQLSVPFPVVTSSNGPGSQSQYILPANVCGGDSLSISKSPPCKNSFGIENSLSTSSEDPHSGCPSRSSSSLSFHSTPPPLPMLQPSPASLPLPGAQQVNGLARAAGGGLAGASGGSHGLSAVPMVDGLLGSLAGAQQMPLNGILGSLNGAQPAPPPSAAPALQLSTSLSSVVSLSPLTEQQRHVLQQHEQQLQQLQQLLTSQPLNPEQQALVFQMMQQIQQKRELQRLQMSGSSQLSLLAATSAPLHPSPSALLTSAAPSGSSLLASLSPQQLNPGGALLAPQATPPLGSGPAMAPNPFLSLQPDGSTPKGTVGRGLPWAGAGDSLGQGGDSVGIVWGQPWGQHGNSWGRMQFLPPPVPDPQPSLSPCPPIPVPLP
uniref:MLLT6, PHD finger containing n=1 Tax=Junco hyemalis TaxID=40217 RepID=A0A8C5J0H3_JUNHY